MRKPRFYLDVPVEVTDAPNVRGHLAQHFGTGWLNARWPDGKVYTHESGSLAIP